MSAFSNQTKQKLCLFALCAVVFLSAEAANAQLYLPNEDEGNSTPYLKADPPPPSYVPYFPKRQISEDGKQYQLRQRPGSSIPSRAAPRPVNQLPPAQKAVSPPTPLRERPDVEIFVRQQPSAAPPDEAPIAQTNAVEFSSEQLRSQPVQPIVKKPALAPTPQPAIREITVSEPAMLPDPEPAREMNNEASSPSTRVKYFEGSSDQSLPTLKEVAPDATVVTKIDAVPSAAADAPDQFSSQTKDILSKLPKDIFPEDVNKTGGNVSISRSDPARDVPGVNFNSSQNVEGSINVKRQPIDINYELEKAYNALLRGNTQAAIRIYKDVLDTHPDNKHALFGLATTYHRLEFIEQARPLYARLLEIDPYNKEVLNNFLALVGMEAPESAILYLEQLKQSNSGFSPIYAQLAQLYHANGQMENAILNMQQAVDIDPDNLVYIYNLAVLYDMHKDYRRAENLYRKLVRFELEGKEIPASLRDIQERLTFLASN